MLFFEVIIVKFDYNNNFLYFYSILLKSYKDFSTDGLKGFDLKPIEIEILKFLINNGEHFNTARDISTYKGVSKALVSKGVNDLINLGYLKSISDENDKRILKLYITKKADPVVKRLNEINLSFYEKISKDISEDDMELLKNVNMRILNNLERF